MTDVFDASTRSKVMRAIRSGDTSPERLVRQTLHRLGFRYRLHVASIPGKPDLVFPARRKVIFVHGCFWHRHRCKSGQSMPASNIDFWQAKFERNRLRDRTVVRDLRALWWKPLIVWECQLRPHRREATFERVVSFLNS